MVKRHLLLYVLLLGVFINSNAQVGEYRNRWALGVNGGVALNKVSFQPSVPQNMHKGSTFGFMVRYTSEKYFSTICSVQLECNIANLGWKQDIRTIEGTPVINPWTKTEESFERNIAYVQIPLLAHLAWGKEQRGINAFVNLGPQIGFVTSHETNKNYDQPYVPGSILGNPELPRANSEVAQETLDIRKKFDYGIAVGAGIEWDIKYVGRFSLEGRYYYGLGDMFGASKYDEFGKSSNGTIYLRLGYMHDL